MCSSWPFGGKNRHIWCTTYFLNPQIIWSIFLKNDSSQAREIESESNWFTNFLACTTFIKGSHSLSTFWMKNCFQFQCQSLLGEHSYHRRRSNATKLIFTLQYLEEKALIGFNAYANDLHLATPFALDCCEPQKNGIAVWFSRNKRRSCFLEASYEV